MFHCRACLNSSESFLAVCWKQFASSTQIATALPYSTAREPPKGAMLAKQAIQTRACLKGICLQFMVIKELVNILHEQWNRNSDFETSPRWLIKKCQLRMVCWVALPH